MAMTNKYTCRTCGTQFEFCLKCQFSRPDYDAESFCSKEHDAIHAILSKHGCNLITADEALKELSAYNIDEIKFTENIVAHIERIKSEATVKAETSAHVEAEKPAVMTAKQSNKNHKKKW